MTAKQTNSSKTISSNGLSLLVKHETFVGHLYNDMSTKDKKGKNGRIIKGKEAGNCTIGEGTLVHKGICDGRESEFPYLKGISNDSAITRRNEALNTAARSIKNHLTVDVNQNVFDALSVFVYNVGTKQAGKSQVYTLINEGKLDEAAQEMRKFVNVTVNGKPVHAKGLDTRRKEETDLLLLQPTKPKS